MYCKPKDDTIVMKALDKANKGFHHQAARLFQDAGNQYRNPSDKQKLWQAAERHRKIALSD